jgi:peptidoglycan glycosyltransferase
MSGRIQNIAVGSLIAFLIVALNLTYWSAIERDTLRARADNPRRIEDERAILRGSILDRNQIVLARSEPTVRLPSGRMAQRRVYPQASAFSATGYYSLIYGSSGAEFAFDRALRGAARMDLWSAVFGELLNRSPRGDDLRLTIDASLQAAAAEAFGTSSGALVLLEVPSGAVWTLYSAPLYDPNTLDADWERLRSDPRAPLLNRALQGTYQMGGALQLVIYSAMLANPALQPQMFDSAALPVALDDFTARCLVESPLPIESLQSALARSCPNLFAEFAVQYPAEVQEKISAFGLLSAPRLNGYPTAPELRSTPLDALRDPSDRLRAGLGQGDLRATPLQMALVASGIANYGNVVTPYIAEALRAPDSETWEVLPRAALERAAMTREAAGRMRAALREAVLIGSAQAAAQFNFPPEVMLYAHASQAFSGASQNSWLIGFVDLPDGRALAIAVIVEAADDAQVAARIGGQLLAMAAWRALPD